jgi:hypothetical protein
MHEELKPLRLTSRPQIQTEYKGHKVRAVRSGVYFRPQDETFHDFLVNHLLWTLGKSWFEAEVKKPLKERHVVLQWRKELYDQVREARETEGDTPGPVGFVPRGNVKALLVLADDVYQLEHALRTPKAIIRRLRDRRQFQGARYEILSASIFARCSFDIEFIDDKTKKTPEFYATKKQTGEKVAVEAKSRHRKGVLHEPASAVPVPPGTMKAQVEHLFREALEQAPGNMPFFIFIDLNLPLTPGVPTPEKPWFKELKELLDRLKTPTPENPDEFTGVVFTNFGWHYSRDKSAPGGEYVIVASVYPRYPVSAETWNTLNRALNEYGFIPDEEQHEKEVRARYPEFGGR